MDSKKIFEKLRRVSNAADSIQSTAKYFFDHKKFCKQIVDSWIKVFKESTDDKKLTLMYLANEILQTCKRYQATDYKNIYRNVLSNIFELLQGSQYTDKYKRILNIWASRNVFETNFVGKLIELIDTRPEIREPSPDYDEQQELIDAKIIEDFNPEDAFKALSKLWMTEQQVEIRHRHIVQSKIDLSLLEPNNIWQLKDRETARQFVKDLEEWTTILRASEKVTTESLEARRNLNSILQRAELFYQAQSNDAHVVLKAYKTYGARISKVKETLNEQLEFLPDEEDIASITDVLDDAPSPGNTPPHLKDVELEDIDDDPAIPQSRLSKELRNAQPDVVNELLDEDMDVVSDDEDKSRERHASKLSEGADRPYSPSRDNLDLLGDDKPATKSHNWKPGKPKARLTNIGNSNRKTSAGKLALPPKPMTPPPPPDPPNLTTSGVFPPHQQVTSAVVDAVGSKNISRLFEPPPPPPPPPPPSATDGQLISPLGSRHDVDMRVLPLSGKDFDMRQNSYINNIHVDTPNDTKKKYHTKHKLDLPPGPPSEDLPNKKSSYEEFVVSPSGSSTPTQDEPAQENPTSMLQPSNPDSAMTFLSSFIQMNTGFSFGGSASTYSAVSQGQTGAQISSTTHNSMINSPYANQTSQWQNWSHPYSGYPQAPLQPVIPNSVCQASGHPTSPTTSNDSVRAGEAARVQRPRAIRHSKQPSHSANDSEDKKQKNPHKRSHSSSSPSSTNETEESKLLEADKRKQQELTYHRNNDHLKINCQTREGPYSEVPGANPPAQSSATFNYRPPPPPHNMSWHHQRPAYHQFYQPMRPRGHPNHITRFY